MNENNTDNFYKNAYLILCNEAHKLEAKNLALKNKIKENNKLLNAANKKYSSNEKYDTLQGQQYNYHITNTILINENNNLRKQNKVITEQHNNQYKAFKELKKEYNTIQQNSLKSKVEEIVLSSIVILLSFSFAGLLSYLLFFNIVFTCLATLSPLIALFSINTKSFKNSLIKYINPDYIKLKKDDVETLLNI